MSVYIDKVIEMIDLSQNLPLNQIIYDGLRTAIITGVIPMGERINEKYYAESLNVSRTPVREALRRIQDEEIVEYIPNYGIVVSTFDVEDVKEIYQIRTALDILAATNAMKLMTEEKAIKMETLLDKTDEAQRNHDVEGVIEMSKEFNTMIYEFAEMPRLESIQNRLRDYLMRFRDISLTADKRRERALAEHRLIFRCLKNGDVEQMRLVIAEHLMLSEEFILLELERQTKK
ncbi:GntR family transcriptional regulator [Erysipelothrix inopinata]|uniref:GntR family transcriptional regulator n=1 Tax=Erysipelothrix inopinata TaxID=225084 RepID=A0A7G9RWK5_9FIRM|nr:GntR family transcriptional regulator [Erysipelothrix inopinata]QNN59980.1 GntR family transcriptional regulator [Erysipelothrix inopinata]